MQPKPSARRGAKRSPGITIRHSRGCASRAGAPCDCTPTYQAHVWSSREGRRIRKTFPTISAAKGWRADALSGLRKGTMKAPSRQTLNEAAEALLAGMRDGGIRNRSGDVYKPSAVRGYEAALRDRILPALGAHRLTDIEAADIRAIVERMQAQGLDASTIRNAVMPLRVIFRRAVRDGAVAANPTAALELPAVRGVRDRIAEPEEARRLIAALPEGDRALWTTAIFAGLRAGELQALRWCDVDLATGSIAVERSYDPKSRVYVEPKSRAGTRAVPMTGTLRDALLAHKMAGAQDAPDALVFGRRDGSPFNNATVRNRALAAWEKATKKAQEADPNAAPFVPISLHECRHTFASMMIAAGVGAKALSTYIGHAGIQITLDRYGHLMQSAGSEDAARLDDYLARSNTAGRIAQLGG